MPNLKAKDDTEDDGEDTDLGNNEVLSAQVGYLLEPPQQRGPAARGFVETPRIPPKQQQGSNRL